MNTNFEATIPRAFAIPARWLWLFAMLFLASCFPNSGSGDFIALDKGPFRAVYLVPDPHANLERVEVIIQAGEIDNTGPEGLAHYTEHLAWLPKLDPTRETSRHTNALTNPVATRYFILGPGADLEANIDRLMDVFQPFQPSPDFMREERDIVRREYDLGVLENPGYALYAEARRWLHDGTPFARSVIGTPETIERFTLAAATAFHARTHRAANAVLLVTGQTSERKLARLLAALDSAPTDARTEPPLMPPPIAAPDRQDQRVTLPGIAGPELRFQKLVPVETDLSDAKIAATIEILTDMLDSGLPGGIAGPLRFDNFFARTYQLSLSHWGNSHLDLFFEARPDSGVSLEDLLIAFEAALGAHAQNGLPEESFETVKARNLDGLAQEEWSAFQTMELVTGQIMDRRAPFGFSELVAAYESVTIHDVNALYRALLAEGRTHVLRAVPPE